MKRLFSENTSAGFKGNVLSEENFNDLVESLMMADPYSMTETGDSFTFDNGVRVDITSFDDDGDFLTVQVESDFETERAPLYPNFDRTSYRNPDITLVDLDSEYTLLRTTGVPIPRADYTLEADGYVVFVSAQADEHLMIDELVYTIRNLITVTRDTDTKEIVGFTIVNNTNE